MRARGFFGHRTGSCLSFVGRSRRQRAVFAAFPSSHVPARISGPLRSSSTCRGFNLPLAFSFLLPGTQVAVARLLPQGLFQMKHGGEPLRLLFSLGRLPQVPLQGEGGLFRLLSLSGVQAPHDHRIAIHPGHAPPIPTGGPNAGAGGQRIGSGFERAPRQHASGPGFTASAAGKEPLAVRTERQMADRKAGTAEGRQVQAQACVPHLYRSIMAGAGEALTIRAESHAVDALSVALERQA